MATFEMDSCVRGHHISKTFWSPTIGEELLCQSEEGNSKDPYAVALVEKTKGAVVGHVPRKISAACSVYSERRHYSVHCYGKETVFARPTTKEDWRYPAI